LYGNNTSTVGGGFVVQINAGESIRDGTGGRDKMTIHHCCLLLCCSVAALCLQLLCRKVRQSTLTPFAVLVVLAALAALAALITTSFLSVAGLFHAGHFARNQTNSSFRTTVRRRYLWDRGVVGSVMNEPKINKNQQIYIFSQKKPSPTINTTNQFLTNLMTVFKGIFTNGAFSRSTPIM